MSAGKAVGFSVRASENDSHMSVIQGHNYTYTNNSSRYESRNQDITPPFEF